MKVGDYKIPFDENGNLCHHDSDVPPYRGGPVWKDNAPFKENFKYVGFSRGRSAAYLEFEGVESGKRASMFLKDFDTIVKLMSRGCLSGTFAYCKRGQNYGLKFLHS